jgi:hypothetical protein
MKYSPEDIARKLDLLQQQQRALAERTRERAQIDRFMATADGASDVIPVANTLYLFPLFPQAAILAQSIELGAYRNPTNPGTSTVQLALYQAILDDQDGLPPTVPGLTWAAVSTVNPFVRWRKLIESPLVLTTISVPQRLRWVMPQEYNIAPGPNTFAIGVLADSADTFFLGVGQNMGYVALRAAEPASVTALPSNTGTTRNTAPESVISLTLLSRRGMRVMGL